MSICNICYESKENIKTLICCNGKVICNKCKSIYNKSICPFCRQNMNPRSTFIIVRTTDKKILTNRKKELILSVMNYNIFKVW